MTAPPPHSPARRSRLASAGPAFGWTAVAALTYLALGRLGHLDGVGHDGAALPNRLDPQLLQQWIAERGAATASLSLVRLGAQAACIYLMLVSVATIAVSLSGWRPAIELLRLAGGPLARRLLAPAAAALATATSAVVAPSVAWATGAAPPPPVTMVVGEGPAPPVDAPPLVTMMVAGADPASPPPSPSPSPSSSSPPPPSPPPPAGGAMATYVVRPGDHFWSIAEAQVRAVAPGRPSTREVARYWRRLVAANRARLAVPGDADLLFAGQELVLPKPG